MSNRGSHQSARVARRGLDRLSTLGLLGWLRPATCAAAIAATLALGLTGAATASSSGSFLSRFHAVSRVASTVPARGPAAGDQNPYGTAVVPRTIGALVRGDVLVSNFDDAAE